MSQYKTRLKIRFEPNDLVCETEWQSAFPERRVRCAHAGLKRCKYDTKYSPAACPLAVRNCCRDLKSGNTPSRKAIRGVYVAGGGKPSALTRKIKGKHSDPVKAYNETVASVLASAGELMLTSSGGSTGAAAFGEGGITVALTKEKNGGVPVFSPAEIFYSGNVTAAERAFFLLLRNFGGEDVDSSAPVSVPGIAFAEKTVPEGVKPKGGVSAVIGLAVARRGMFVLNKLGADKIKYPTIRMAGSFWYSALEELPERSGKKPDEAAVKALVMLCYLSKVFGLKIDGAAFDGTAEYDAERYAALLSSVKNSESVRAAAAELALRSERLFVSSFTGTLAEEFTGKTEEYLASGFRAGADMLSFDAVFSAFTAVACAHTLRSVWGFSAPLSQDFTAAWNAMRAQKEADRWFTFFDERFNLSASYRAMLLLSDPA